MSAFYSDNDRVGGAEAAPVPTAIAPAHDL